MPTRQNGVENSDKAYGTPNLKLEVHLVSEILRFSVSRFEKGEIQIHQNLIKLRPRNLGLSFDAKTNETFFAEVSLNAKIKNSFVSTFDAKIKSFSV